MLIFELGTNIAPAYAGMILVEQGHRVVKFTTDDPLIHQPRGGDLWWWLNGRKTVHYGTHAKEALELATTLGPEEDVGVVDNFRAQAWERWELDPAALAAEHNLRWVSMRADDDERSFDVVAQARAWGDLCPPVPFYLGDTAFGLWAAFKLLAMPAGTHAVIRHATALAKLVEGELVIPRGREPYPWKDEGTYGFDYTTGEAYTLYRGVDRITEPLRDREWRRVNLEHDERGHFQV